MTFHKKAIKLLAKQFQEGKRKIIICGGKTIENGFKLHPARIEDLDFLTSEGEISKEITIEDAVKLVDNEFCTNKKAFNEFLIVIQAL